MSRNYFDPLLALPASPAPNVLNLGVATYPESAGVTPGETLGLCVQPNQTFRVAFYTQGVSEALSPASPPPLVQDLRWVTRTGQSFTSWPVSSPQEPDVDWNWPRIGFAIPATWTSGVYVAVVYPVDASGAPTDDLGRAVVAGDPNGQIKPHPLLPPDPTQQQVVAWDHGMALFVVRPTPAAVASGAAAIAYVLAVSTYQAYNNTPRCFYYDNPVSRVTLRRPGGGVGSTVMNDERDPYDGTSMRNTYAHWDARFIRWLAQNAIACHFYTSFDLDNYQTSQPNFLLDAQGDATYELALCTGHDEYWSMAMRQAIEAFLDANGNVAVFSGNTCYRPVGFGTASATTSRYDPPATPVPADLKSIMTRLNDNWPDSINEASTIGVTWKTGAGCWNFVLRPGSGYLNAFRGSVLTAGFGSLDCLVGYECDAVFTGHTPANYAVLAHASMTAAIWNQKGNADMGFFQRNLSASARKSLLFNAATTDWARLLPLSSTDTDPEHLIVQQLTLQVLSALVP